MKYNTTEEIKTIVKELWKYKDEKLISLALSCLDSADKQQRMIEWLKNNENYDKIEAQNMLLSFTIE